MRKIKTFLKKLFSNKTKLWKLLTFLFAALFLFLLIFVVRFFVNKTAENTDLSNNICQDCARRKIDGFYVNKNDINPPLIAVMIDNHPEARPILGIENASLVYEAEVEGGYTRYMAIFIPDVNFKEIGAVRSARPYFVHWAEEIGAIYAHCGGSPEALAILADNDIIDMNEFYNGKYFWRSESRLAPHNIMTSGEDLIEFINNKNISATDFSSWEFKDDNDLESRGEDGGEVKINFSSKYFAVSWRYNVNENNYTRLSSSGDEQLTSEKNNITAKNLIIQKITAQVIDEKLRLKMDTVGEGDAIICLDGVCKSGRWVKADLNSRTKFYNSNGEEFLFNAGSTWIEIVKPEIEIEY